MKGRPKHTHAPSIILRRGFDFLGRRIYDRNLNLRGECIGLLATGRALVLYDDKPQSVIRVPVEHLEPE